MSHSRRKLGTVAGPHPVTSKAGMAMLKAGGNAVDAAVAAAFTSGVVDPASNGVGGYGGCLVIYLAKQRRVVAIDCNTVAPAAASADMFEIVKTKDPAGYRVPGRVNVHGPRAVGVPGVVAGLCLALRRYGTVPLQDALQPAIRAARNGFAVTKLTRAYLAEFATQMCEEYPETARVHLVNGRAPTLGERQKNPDLARTLEAIGEGGPAAFYKGPIASKIAAHIQESGGCLTTDDLRRYRARVVEPYTIDYRSYRLFTSPIGAGGLTTLQMLRLIEAHDIGSMPLAGRLHLMAEAMKVCWPERLRRFGDPDFVDVDVAAELADELTARLQRRLKIGLAAPKPGRVVYTEPMHSTVHISTADIAGNMVSLTQTHGGAFGSVVTVPGTGLLLGHGVARFDPRPGLANSIAPGKAPLHNMAPFIALEGNRPFASYGIPGGRTIPNNQFNFTVSLLDLARTALQTVSAPRLHTEGAEPIQVEKRAGKRVLEAMEKRGHRVVPADRIGGPGHAIVVNGDDVADQSGATDPYFQGAVVSA